VNILERFSVDSMIIALLIFTISVCTSYSEIETNSSPESSSLLVPLLEKLDFEEDQGFLQTFEKRFTETVDLFEDRFGVQTQVDWIRRYETLGYELHDKQNKEGTKYFQKSLAISARESLPQIIDMTALQSGISDTFEGIFGNPRESEFGLVSSIHSATEDTWRMQVRQSRLKYGLRPFSVNPYAYLSYVRNKGGNILYELHARVYFRGLNGNRVSLGINLPIMDGYEIVAGTSIRPSEFGVREYTESSVRLERTLRDNKFFSVGFSTDRNGWIASIILSKRL
jgi:hypothetical protein